MTGPLPPEEDLVWRDGLRLFTAASALVRIPEDGFKRFPVEARVALGMVPGASDVLRPLVRGGHSTVAGRLAGAFRRTGRADVADEILETMASAGYDVREADPFSPNEGVKAVHPKSSPMTTRIEGLWSTSRDQAIERIDP